ncbi:MAG: fibronectin type III domain-containing protein, partial [Victivallales bacterium]|nr:fibronectin type III domain-containing protein [Victivallales bacterium]
LAEAPARERTNIIKELLRSRYTDRPELREHYNLDKNTPRSRVGMMRLADGILEMHARLVAEGDPLVLPDAMMDNLSALIDAVKAASSVAYDEREDATMASKELQALYNTDSKKLKLLYDWAVAMWGANDPRMIEIGFVQRFPQSGGGGGEVPDVPEDFMYSWLDPFLKFTWDALESVTSYQLAYSEDGGATWEELYSGDEVGYEYEPPVGARKYRVRARNANGYGDWSGIIEYEVEGEPPMGEWPNELTGLYAIHHDVPAIFNEIGHDGQTGADSYRLKRVKVLIADPDPTNADMPVENYVEGLSGDPYADTDINPGDKCAYWVCGVDEFGVEGAWTGPAICEYPVE